MTDTIPNVPRELKPCPFCGDSDLLGFEPSNEGGWTIVRCRGCGASGSTGRSTSEWEAAAYLNRRAPSPAGVDGLETIGYATESELAQLLDPTMPTGKYVRIGLDHPTCWKEDAPCEHLVALCVLSDAQAIIDGLRGEVGAQRVKTCIALKERNDAREERDQQAQRIGELEGLLREAYKYPLNHACETVDFTAQDLCERIEAILSAGKDGE